jgi:Zn-dependent M32 family carboxypeptidase
MNKQIMKALGFDKEVEKVESGACPFCSKKIDMKDFRNELSVREYKISGLCQNCQDKMFGSD